MPQRLAFATLLLMSSTLVAPAVLAQAGGTAAPAPASPPPAQTSTPATSSPGGASDPQAAAPTSTDQQAEAPVEVSAPGAEGLEDIVVVGRNIPNTVRATAQIVSVLSSGLRGSKTIPQARDVG